MNRYIFILLINVILIFGAKAKYHADPSCMTSKYDIHDSPRGEIELAQISTVSFGIIEANDILTDHLTISNKHLHNGNHSIYRLCKMDFALENINLRYFTRKDIHFLSALLI